MKKLLSAMFAAALVISAPASFAEEKQTKEEKTQAEADEKRAEIDKVSAEALKEVLTDSEKAQGLYDGAYGWAVFDNLRVTFIITGGGGSGVAVAKESGERTYMKMGSGGLAFGIGAQKYSVIMLFEDEKTFTNFIEKGWKAETGATAAAGTEGANVATGFINGIAVYQITQSGLMASADISGTKYTVDKKLND